VASVSLLSLWLSSAKAFNRVPVARTIVVTEAYRHEVDTLRRNEALGTLFIRAGVAGGDVGRLLAAAPALDPRRTRAGQVFRVRYILGDSVPDYITTRLDADRVLHLTRGNDRWESDVERVFWQIQPARAEGVMSSSLSESLHQIIPDSVLPPAERERFISDLADGVFGWEIDFSRDIAKGDRFSVVYERLQSSLDDVRYGRLVAARIQTRGRMNAAYLLPDTLGHNAYFDDHGVSLKRAFKRNPVAFLRISSGFTNARLHPVLGIFRAHRGTDFAARMGTEIYATGDGVIRFAGRDGGYGNMVAIRHPKSIETRYAHMMAIRRGIAPGVRVQQGEVIGYVGATGLASGPHVHYEFLKNGQQVDSRKVDYGEGSPVPNERLKEFFLLKDSYLRLLDPPPADSAARSAPPTVAAGSS
jgi:murein DD-endopeptidase MepM/ murein hydrolase activator NlpD